MYASKSGNTIQYGPPQSTTTVRQNLHFHQDCPAVQERCISSNTYYYNQYGAGNDVPPSQSQPPSTSHGKRPIIPPMTSPLFTNRMPLMQHYPDRFGVWCGINRLLTNGNVERLLRPAIPFCHHQLHLPLLIMTIPWRIEGVILIFVFLFWYVLWLSLSFLIIVGLIFLQRKWTISCVCVVFSSTLRTMFTFKLGVGRNFSSVSCCVGSNILVICYFHFL